MNFNIFSQNLKKKLFTFFKHKFVQNELNFKALEIFYYFFILVTEKCKESAASHTYVASQTYVDHCTPPERHLHHLQPATTVLRCYIFIVWKNRMNSTFSFKQTKTNQLPRQGIEQILPPIRRDDLCLLFYNYIQRWARVPGFAFPAFQERGNANFVQERGTRKNRNAKFAFL